MPASAAVLATLKKCGADVTIYDRALVIGAEHIEVGDSVIIDDFAMIYAAAPTRIGSFVHIASHVCITGGAEFEADDFVGISGGVRIYTGNDDYSGASLTGPTVPDEWRGAVRSPVRVGKHVVVGANSVVLPGVTIGDGATVGALSLVTQDLEPWTVNVGVPAKPIKERPRERILELAADLRRTLYDAAGRYIPAAER